MWLVSDDWRIYEIGNHNLIVVGRTGIPSPLPVYRFGEPNVIIVVVLIIVECSVLSIPLDDLLLGVYDVAKRFIHGNFLWQVSVLIVFIISAETNELTVFGVYY